MGMFNVGASEVLHRYVYPPFASLWSSLRTLTGRQRRDTARADLKTRSDAKRRHKALWNQSHDR